MWKSYGCHAVPPLRSYHEWHVIQLLQHHYSYPHEHNLNRLQISWSIFGLCILDDIVRHDTYCFNPLDVCMTIRLWGCSTNVTRGIMKHNFTFVISAFLSVVSTVLLLAGAAIWTVLVNKAKSINTLTIGSQSVPLGIVVTSGVGLSLAWASFVISAISVIPYMLKWVARSQQRIHLTRFSCFTYRGWSGHLNIPLYLTL